MKLSIKLGNCVVIILMLTRDENRAELEEHANPFRSGSVISRIGSPRGYCPGKLKALKISEEIFLVLRSGTLRS
jgi:hypothetical protein